MIASFVELICGARAVDRRIPEISVLIDLDTLQSGLHPDSCSETSGGDLLPPETIRRMCCDGGIIPIVLGGHGEAASTKAAGNSTSTPTPTAPSPSPAPTELHGNSINRHQTKAA